MSTSTTKPIAPSDALLRPKPSKKKSTGARRPNQKSSTKKSAAPGSALDNTTANLVLDCVDDEELINQMLEGVPSEPPPTLYATPDAQPSTSEVASTHSSASHGGLSQKMVQLKEEVKEVAHHLASSISPNALGPMKRRNRQKDRLARRQAAEEAVREDARQETRDLGPDADERKKESEAIESACEALGVRTVEMNPDGHCLFSAIADQLDLHRVPLKGASSHSYRTCRSMAAEYMRQHPDDFIHYLPASDDGVGEGLMSQAQYQKHCDQVRDSAEWGGEPEILALSKCYKFPIHIVQASTSPLKIGQEDYGHLRAGKALMLSYHRKSYGLGEHYNSLHPR